MYNRRTKQKRCWVLATNILSCTFQEYHILKIICVTMLVRGKKSIYYASGRCSTEISVQEHKHVIMKDELEYLELNLIHSL